MRGFEHNVVIYIQFRNPSDFEKREFIDDLNIVLRTTATLSVVSVSTPLLDPKDTTEYRSYMDVDKIEALLIECNKKLHDVFSEEIVRNIEYMREQAKKIENQRKKQLQN